MKRITLLFIGALALCIALLKPALAQGQQEHGRYTVYHTVFNSTFLQPHIAQNYGLVRGNHWFLINISVNADGKMYGQEAQLTGTATDLMQKQVKLNFQEISEGNATYYIAPLRLAGQDILHFAIDVKPTPDADPFTVKFTHKFAKE